MNFKKIIRNLVFPLALFSTAANAALVQATAPNPIPNVGDTVAVDILGYNFPTGSFHGGLDITWDTSKLSLQRITLAPGEYSSIGTMTEGNIPHFSFGSDFICYICNNPQFNIVTFNFQVISGGQSSFNIIVDPTNTWVTSTGVPIDITTLNASITGITATPIPPSLILFGTGLLGLIGISRKGLNTT